MKKSSQNQGTIGICKKSSNHSIVIVSESEYPFSLLLVDLAELVEVQKAFPGWALDEAIAHLLIGFLAADLLVLGPVAPLASRATITNSGAFTTL